MVSVIIPVYNKARRLHACLDSVLAQTYTDFEVICVDDGSSDGSAEILAEYASNDSRVTVITQANAGVSMARNAGIDASHGTSLCFMDADDTIAPDFLATLAPRAGDADIVECSTAATERLWQGDELWEFVDTVGRTLNGTSVWGKLYSASFVRRNALRFPQGVRFGEDTEFNLAAWSVADAIVDLPYSGYKYYNDGEGVYSLTPDEIIRKIDALAAGYGKIGARFGKEFSIARDINITLSLYPIEQAIEDDGEYRELYKRYTPGADDRVFYADHRCSPIIRSVIAARNMVKAGNRSGASSLLHRAYHRYGSRFLSAPYPYRATHIHGVLTGLGLARLSLMLMKRI